MNNRQNKRRESMIIKMINQLLQPYRVLFLNNVPFAKNLVKKEFWKFKVAIICFILNALKTGINLKEKTTLNVQFVVSKTDYQIEISKL